MKKVELSNGTTKVIQYSESIFYCRECGEEYLDTPLGGYCDQKMDCATYGKEAIVRIDN